MPHTGHSRLEKGMESSCTRQNLNSKGPSDVLYADMVHAERYSSILNSGPEQTAIPFHSNYRRILKLRISSLIYVFLRRPSLKTFFFCSGLSMPVCQNTYHIAQHKASTKQCRLLVLSPLSPLPLSVLSVYRCHWPCTPGRHFLEHLEGTS